ncbi:MAG: diguanylate cyclase [Desulfobacteraceae bacterium]|nr:diguanylate cyclase [Desulfobacteraceae bacterium]
MGFSGKDPKRTNSETDTPLRNDRQKDRDVFFLQTIKTMLLFLKDFALDIEEIQSGQYKQDMDSLSGVVADHNSSQEIEPAFKTQKLRIADFIDRQKSYILEKERELKDIIELLSQAMVNLNVENREIYERVQDHGERIEEITLLDDIKKIKQVLKEEVNQMRLFMTDKQKSENEQISRLSNKVVILKRELENAKNKSVKDGLTGIYNRQAFDEYAGQAVKHCADTREPMSLLLLDIDDFKTVNDTHGHLIGDRVLMAFSNKCKGSVRSEDFLARYGGEEFVILLKGASLRNATKKAKAICKSIASTRYAIDDNPNGETLKITVSIGCSAQRKGDTLEDILDRADRSLYIAKRNGKNRVVNEKKL